MFDLLVASLALAILAAPMAIIAILIKATSRGPVFYVQRRLTYSPGFSRDGQSCDGMTSRTPIPAKAGAIWGGGQTFDMLKFRSMVADAEKNGAVFAAEDDPRCTRVGRALRRTGLDELPQLWNVVKGEMSLVGPRPERPELMAGILAELPRYGRRLEVRAGMTGLAQVKGYRGNTSFKRRLAWDRVYVRRWSIWLDLWILAMTPVVLGVHALACFGRGRGEAR